MRQPDYWPEHPRKPNIFNMSDPKKVIRCSACGSEDVVAISMDLEGSGVVFRACHRCEHRWWEKDGYEIPLESVLEIVPRR
ncbi:MAG TPA: hypothetical protein VEA19_06085 [Actinomycetota bacterium]|nr:hypothetical protein [Actinomycetota bacterium]